MPACSSSSPSHPFHALWSPIPPFDLTLSNPLLQASTSLAACWRSACPSAPPNLSRSSEWDVVAGLPWRKPFAVQRHGLKATCSRRRVPNIWDTCALEPSSTPGGLRSPPWGPYAARGGGLQPLSLRASFPLGCASRECANVCSAVCLR